MSTFSCATFRIPGAAATAQNLFTIFNSGTNRVVRIRRLVMQMDATAVLTAVMPIVKTSRITTAPTGGGTPAKVQWDTSLAASHADIVARGGASADGTASAITATAGNILWQQYGMRLHTAVGQVLGIDNNVLTSITEGTPVVLRQNEGLLVQVVAAAAASNPNTNHWFVQCAWDEQNS
jgi:ribosomal protein L27